MTMTRWLETAVSYVAGGTWHLFQSVNQCVRAGSFQPSWASAPLPKARAHVARARLAAHDRFVVPHLCQRDAHPHSLGRRRRQSILVTEHVGEIKAAHPRTRRQGDHRENLPAARHVHRRAGDQSGLPEADRRSVPGSRLRRGYRSTAQSRDVIDQIRPRIGPHRRPDQPMQHDVRPVLHGRQSGRLRPRADIR